MNQQQSKIIQLEKLVSKIKMSTGLEFQIKADRLELKAGELAMSELYALTRFCERRGLEYKLTGKLTFKISQP